MATVDPLQTFVGPRILIKFAGAWEQAQAYEYMTAVYDTAYQSWVSKCDVPANTPLVEGDYWMKWSDPNAQFQLLQQTVQSFDDRISANTTGLADETTNRESADTALQNQITAITKQKKAILIGDSYLREYSGSGFTNPGWGDMFAEQTGWDCTTRYKSGGAGWVALGTSDTEAGLNFGGMLQKAHTEHTDDAETFDAIVVNGIINDLQSGQNANTIITNIYQFIENAREWFPYATCYISFALCSNEYEENTTYYTVLQNVYAVNTNASKAAVIATDSHNWLFYQANSWGRGDDIHPNEDGYEALAACMARFALGVNKPVFRAALTLSEITSILTQQWADFTNAFTVNYGRYSIVDNIVTFVLSLEVKNATLISSAPTALYLPFASTIASGVRSGQTWITQAGQYYPSPAALYFGVQNGVSKICFAPNPNIVGATLANNATIVYSIIIPQFA